MDTRTSTTLSVILTIIAILLISVFAFLMQIVLMNGVVSTSQTNIALGASLSCQGVNVLLGAILAGRLTRLYLTRFRMHKGWAVVLAILPVTVMAAILSAIAIFVGLAVAGIK
jgi:hypothetical protein